MAKRPNRAMRRRMKQYLASQGIVLKRTEPIPAQPVARQRRIERVSYARSLSNPSYVAQIAQLLADATGRPQAVVRDNGNKCYCVVESAARNAKPSRTPARMRRPGGIIGTPKKRGYFPASRIGGRVYYPKGSA